MCAVRCRECAQQARKPFEITVFEMGADLLLSRSNIINK